MPDVRNEIIDNLQVRGSIGGGVLGSLRQAIRVAMSVATSGSTGIRIAKSSNTTVGTSDFTVHVSLRLPSFAVTSGTGFYFDYTDASNFWYVGVNTGGVARIFVRLSGSTLLDTSAVITDTTGRTATFTYVVTRETATTAGSVSFYLNGVLLGSSTIAAGSPSSYPSGTVYLLGTNSIRLESDTLQAILYNRALTAAEVLSLYNNGPALADLGASQTAVYTSDFSAGVDGLSASNVTAAGNIDGIEGEDNWYSGYPSTTSNVTRTLAFTPSSGGIFSRASRAQWLQISFKYFVPAGQTNTNGIRLIAINTGDSTASETPAVEVNLNTTGAVATYSGYLQMPSNWNGLLYWQLTKNSSPTFAGVTSGTDDLAYIKDIVVKVCGVTGWWNATDAQSNTGQMFDRSGNKNHALLPAAGATVVCKPTADLREVRGTTTWAASTAAQDICGFDQAVLPANAYIESIIGVVSGATVEDITIGDGSDADRFVTITTGLAAGTVAFTLANRTTDGTNLKLKVTPDASATMTISWTVTYRILE